jgi:hypothetical protein
MMYITEESTGKKHEVVVEAVVNEDYRRITKANYFFNWKIEKKYNVYKLRRKDSDIILGLMSLANQPNDKRIEIKLLAVSIENRGKSRKYARIAGSLIGFACKEAMKHYGSLGCVSLVPKTELKKHYIDAYEMKDAGKQVYLEGLPLLKIITNYEP